MIALRIAYRTSHFLKFSLPERLLQDNQYEKRIGRFIVITLRYFVRSYVTNPTTIKAMTDIPAKTPRPMGRTDSFCPGSSNAAADDACCPAVEVLSELEAVIMTSGADVPEIEGLVVVIKVEVPVDDDVVGVGVPVTVDKPCKELN
jgi:hypothetical protein